MLGEECDAPTDPVIARLRWESCPLTASKTQDAISVCNSLSYEPDPLTVPAFWALMCPKQETEL